MKTLFVFLPITLILSATAFGADVDWKLYGTATVDGLKSTCFFDANGVIRVPANNYIKVWTKCLLQSDLDNTGIKNGWDDKKVIAAARKIFDGYTPPIALVEDLNPEQAKAYVAYEEIANLAPIEPQMRGLYELHCDGRKIRTLSFSISSKGKSGSIDRPGNWIDISPETNANRLLKILCR
jgi:hypothetical protein